MQCDAEQKNLISDEELVNGKYVAAWHGNSEQVYESLSGKVLSEIESLPSGVMNNYLVGFAWNGLTTTSEFSTELGFWQFGFAGTNQSGQVDAKTTTAINVASHDYRNIQNTNICIFENGNYNGKFSIMNDNKNFLNDTSLTETRNTWIGYVSLDQTYNRNRQFQWRIYSDGTWQAYVAINSIGENIFFKPSNGSWGNSWPSPQFGFAPNVTKWNQIYNPNIDGKVYQEENDYKTFSRVLLKDGLPLLQGIKDNKITYNFKFSDNTDYYVWLHYGAFSGTPVDNECIECTFTNGSGVETTGKKVLIKNGDAKISFDSTRTMPIYVKWTRVSSGDGRGTINLEGQYSVAQYEER